MEEATAKELAARMAARLVARENLILETIIGQADLSVDELTRILRDTKSTDDEPSPRWWDTLAAVIKRRVSTLGGRIKEVASTKLSEVICEGRR